MARGAKQLVILVNMTESGTRRPWSDAENKATVRFYVEMLKLELRGERFVKTDYNRELQDLIGRSKGAIEFKHSNISAILRDNRALFIDGYKPRSNVQQSLREAVEDVLANDSVLEQLMFRTVRAKVESPQADFILDLSSAPVIDLSQYSYHRRASNVDFVDIEARNSSLGAAGELEVIKFEKHRLRLAGRDDLANKVEHVSKTQGDGLGFDVLSFEPDETEKFIEVKSTTRGVEWPFIVSRNEIKFSQEESQRFHLHRVFALGNDKVGLYTLPGAITDTCLMRPINFEAVPNAAKAREHNRLVFAQP